MIETTLITGGTGFIGHWLSKGLRLSQNAYDNSAWRNGHWKNIIHLAPVPIDDVITCARRCGARVLFASSGGVYDREPDAYFRMKQDDERKLAESGLDYRIARIFTTCGAGMKWKRYAIGNFIMQAHYTGTIDVQSYGQVIRSYMYGSDLAEWLWKILLDGEPGGIYNVGSDEPHSTQELAFEIANHFEPRPTINIERKMQPEPRPWYVPDTTRAREELGLTIKVPFAEAVRLTVEEYRHEQT